MEHVQPGHLGGSSPATSEPTRLCAATDCTDPVEEANAIACLGASGFTPGAKKELAELTDRWDRGELHHYASWGLATAAVRLAEFDPAAGLPLLARLAERATDLTMMVLLARGLTGWLRAGRGGARQHEPAVRRVIRSLETEIENHLARAMAHVKLATEPIREQLDEAQALAGEPGSDPLIVMDQHIGGEVGYAYRG
jgi:hypothetical protein